MIPNEGRGRLLLNMVQHEGIEVRLFTNDLSGARRLALKDLVVPKGVAPIKLDPDKWVIVNDSSQPEVAHPYIRFVFQLPHGRIFGYALVQGKTVLAAEPFDEDSPYFARQQGDELKVRPRLGWMPGDEEDD